MQRTPLVILLVLTSVRALIIIPDEIPTLLSVVYSNIPPIKLGFDTRFGFGFRLGQHADFQTVIELGPQLNTRPIGNSTETLSKRQTFPVREVKRYKLEKKPYIKRKSANNELSQPSLVDLLMGRRKPPNPYIGGAQFQQVPGIDTNLKATKTEKTKAVASPTKFTLI